MEQTVTVGASVIQPAAAVRDFGVLLDQELSMTQHIAEVTSSRFNQLRRLRQIRHPVGQELVAQLVHSFVLSRQLSFSRSAERCSVADSRPIRMNEHVTPALTSGCPSTVEWTSNCAP